MAYSNFIKFFNTAGEDCNFVSESSNFGLQYTGRIFFPRVSTNLIESSQLYILEEVSAFFKDPQLRKLQGTVEVTGGSPHVIGIDTNFTTSLVGHIGGTSGDAIRIKDTNYIVDTVTDDTNLQLLVGATQTVTTDNFYLLDYSWYNRLIQSIDVDTESVVAEFSAESGPFFFYNINYDNDIPIIEKSRTFSFDIAPGSTTQDPRTGRMIVDQNSNDITPISVNFGFSSPDEGIFDEIVTFYLAKSKQFDIASILSQNSDGTWTIDISYIGYIPEFSAIDKLYLARNYNGGYQYFELKLIEAEEINNLTRVIVKEISTALISTIAPSNIGDFKLKLKWKEPLLFLGLYGEAEGEDERFRLTLENFGRKIDEENEYIFRESDINEDLTDYSLLNRKRKEMLLEGDKIFPYMGSYKALINVLNLFGYYDVEIKEYFLNVDDTSPDRGKFLQVPIAKSSEQKKIIKRVWDLLPSKIYKKTSLFGLYYKLNKESGEYDEFGLPLVVEDYQFTPEEVLIKLFGLKELLKKEYLPLNARIYDITGEGLYFERYNFETWSDTVDVRVIDIGKRPVIETFPSDESFIRDVRRIDGFYVDKFKKLGYSGFLGEAATAPNIRVYDGTLAEFIEYLSTTGATGPLGATQNMGYIESKYIQMFNLQDYNLNSISELYKFYVGSFDNYNLGKWDRRDPSWDTMPPGIYNSNFNVDASYYKPLPDDPDGKFPSGAPVLIETLFELTWDECDFSWDQCSTLTTFLANYVVVGSTATVTDLYTTIEKRGFANGDLVSIENSEFSGTYSISNVSGNSFDIVISLDPKFKTGKLTYSIPLSQISTTINHLSWDTIGRGEYLDMRILVEKYGDTSYVYDTGRKPIDEFAVQYLDAVTGLTYSRILDAVLLPYQGTYDVSVYIFDSTNNFTMEYKKYKAVTPNAEITASFQKQEIFDSWDEMNMTWDKASFDWYYPARAMSTWDEADLNWDSLEAYAYRNQTLKDNKVLVDILEINRDLESVKIQGLYTDSPLTAPGNYLYFERKATKLELDSYELVSGSISLTGTNRFYFNYSGDAIQMYSRLLIKKFNVPYYQLTASDFFYADVVSINGSTITLEGPAFYVNAFSLYWASNSVYVDGGVYAGTYAIEILSVKADGTDTVFFLNDSNKELYKLDGYFQPYLTTYDVDYAEAHIGKNANSFDNLSDVKWDDLSEKSWWSEERHAATNSGFLITEVAANGTIKIGDHEKFFFSGDGALNAPEVNALSFACLELNGSKNEGIAKFEYELYPSWQLNLISPDGDDLYTKYNVPPGSTSIELSHLGGTVSVPMNLRITAKLNLSVSGGTVSASIAESGCGYDRPPVVVVDAPVGGTAAVIETIIDQYGRVSGIVVVDGGSGYSTVPSYEMEAPRNAEDWMTNMIWTGNEWHKVVGFDQNILFLENPTVAPIKDFYVICVPYKYHQQIFKLSPKLLKNFYFFILAKCKAPALMGLEEVIFDKGVEGEWLAHPTRTYSHPLKNTLLFLMDGRDLRMDAQYQYWNRNRRDFPVAGENADTSRALYAGAYYEPFAWSDAVITPYSFEIKRSTSVVFHDDATKLPKKTSRSWKIVNDETGEIEVEALSDKLMWNFSKKGKFSVSLDVSDRFGNVSNGTKKSFVIVK